MMDYSTSGGVGEERLSVVDSETERKQEHAPSVIHRTTLRQYHPVKAPNESIMRGAH